MQNQKTKLAILLSVILTAGLSASAALAQTVAKTCVDNGDNTYTYQPSSDTDTVADCSSFPIKRGSHCAVVCSLQDGLGHLHMYGGPIDGQYGKTTADAIVSFQNAWNSQNADKLTVNGATQYDGATDNDVEKSLENGGIPTSDSGKQTAPPANPDVTPKSDNSSGKTTMECPGKDFDSSTGICIPKNNFTAGSLASEKSLSSLITDVLKYLLIFAGIIAVVALVIGGFWYITSGGNEELAEKGRGAITNAIIGLVVVILSYAIVAIVARTLNTPVTPTEILKTK